MTTPKQNLVSARQLIIDSGWCQRAFKKYQLNSDMKHVPLYCAYGALETAIINNEGGLNDQDYKATICYFKQAIAVDQNKPISVWNDDPNRTKQQVIDAFDRAIIIADNSSGSSS